MVECKNSIYEYDGGSDDSPPLVEAAHVMPDLNSLEPMMVHVVTIDGDPLCHASVISTDSADATPMEEDNNGNDEETPSSSSSSKQWSAGIAGGVLGTLVGGPVLGVVAGGAAAYYSQKEGAAGDVTRAMGEVAEATGAKAKELNDKHQLLDKSKEAAETAWNKVKAVNEREKLTDKAKIAAAEAWLKAKELNEKHRLVDKIAALTVFCAKQIVKLVEHVASRLQQIEPRPPHQEARRETSPPWATPQPQPVGTPVSCF